MVNYLQRVHTGDRIHVDGLKNKSSNEAASEDIVI
jgi:hypothetical protein